MTPTDFSQLRVALVADWITDRGGAELVFDQLLALFPEADVFTSVFFRGQDSVYKGRKIITSFIQKIPLLNRRHKMALFLRPFAFRRFNFSNYDLVISSSSAESKGIRVPKNTLHICYCHTPTRYFWSHEQEYRRMMEFGFLNPLARFLFDKLLSPLKKLDLKASQQPHFYIANSENTRSRIHQYYGRDSIVIPPGIDTSFYTQKKEELQCPPLAGRWGKYNETQCDEKEHSSPSYSERVLAKASRIGGGRTASEQPSACAHALGEWKIQSYFASPKDYYFAVGRIVPYKKFDLLIDVFNSNGKKLIIATNTHNKLAQELQTKSNPNITWAWGASQKEIAELYRNARALLFPQEEDFGIVPLEAMACGTPIIAYRKGGALETVIEGTTGIFFDQQAVGPLNATIEQFETMHFEPENIQKHAQTFDQSVFRERILRFIEEKWRDFRNNDRISMRLFKNK